MKIWQNLSLKDIDCENWVMIPGYENQYMVSDMGRVKSLIRVIGGKKNNPNKTKLKILSQGLNRSGYCCTRRVFSFGGFKTNLVHRIVAISFIPNPLSLQEVNHIGINGDKTDNRVQSLCWCTHQENIRHSIDVLNVNCGVNHFRSKLSDNDVIDIFYSKLTNRELAKNYNVSHSVIGSIKNKKSYKFILDKLDNSERVFNSKSQLTKKDIMEIHSSDMSHNEISLKYEVSWATIYLIKSGKKYSDITGGKKFKKKFVSDVDVSFIRNSNVPTSELVTMLGISKSLINNIKAKRAYKWI